MLCLYSTLAEGAPRALGVCTNQGQRLSGAANQSTARKALSMSLLFRQWWLDGCRGSRGRPSAALIVGCGWPMLNLPRSSRLWCLSWSTLAAATTPPCCTRRRGSGGVANRTLPLLARHDRMCRVPNERRVRRKLGEGHARGGGYSRTGTDIGAYKCRWYNQFFAKANLKFRIIPPS